MNIRNADLSVDGVVVSKYSDMGNYMRTNLYGTLPPTRFVVCDHDGNWLDNWLEWVSYDEAVLRAAKDEVEIKEPWTF